MNELLRKHGIVLESDETLIFAKTNKGKYLPYTKQKFIDNYTNSYNDHPEYLVITDRRIIITSTSFYWENIIKVCNDYFTYLFLDIKAAMQKETPIVNTFDGSININQEHISFLSNNKQKKQIIKAWKENGPPARINATNNRFIDRFHLKKGKHRDAFTLYSGQHQDYEVTYSCSRSIPFSGISLTFTFLKPIATRLLIDHETKISSLISQLGLKDIQTTYTQFDDRYLVKSNRPQELKELLTEECINRFNLLYHLGKCSWMHQPLKTSIFKRKSLNSKDDESVLDVPEHIIEESSSSLTVDQKKSKLLVHCALKPVHAYNFHKIDQLLEHTFVITELLIKEFFGLGD